jgi:hypothetical protein
MAKQPYEWFVEPLDANSNESIARELSEEDFYREILCNDGIKRNLWKCSYSFVKFLWESKNGVINIKVFNRTINSGTSRGKIKDVTFLLHHQFLKKKKTQKSKK